MVSAPCVFRQSDCRCSKTDTREKTAVCPEGGDSRKQMNAIFTLAIMGCAVFKAYASLPRPQHDEAPGAAAFFLNLYMD